MDRKKQDLRYEELYNKLLDRGMALHESNKKRIRTGLIFLAVFTVLMILWVVGMFAISIYLISVEYIDDSIRKTLEDVSEREADFGELLPDSEQVRERVHSHIQERHEEIKAHYKDHRRGKSEKAPESEGEQ